jgi:hypothetical protein
MQSYLITDYGKRIKDNQIGDICPICGEPFLASIDILKVMLEPVFRIPEVSKHDSMYVHKKCLYQLERKFGTDPDFIAITLYNKEAHYTQQRYSQKQAAAHIAFLKAVRDLEVETRDGLEISIGESSIDLTLINGDIIGYDRATGSIIEAKTDVRDSTPVHAKTKEYTKKIQQSIRHSTAYIEAIMTRRVYAWDFVKIEHTLELNLRERPNAGNIYLINY